MREYFGTDGFRGEVNVTLTAKHAYELGRYVGYRAAEGKKGSGKRARVVIGKDPRASSYMYEYALSAGICASGADACLLHVTTTPSVSYVARTEDFDLGVMISASHNPHTDNGLKIFSGDGGKADDELIQELERYLCGVEEGKEYLPYATGEDVGRAVDYAQGRNRYIGMLISLSKASFSGVRVCLDCANGSTFAIAKSVFDALGAETICLNAQPNGVNINKNCGSTHPYFLQKAVVENGCDVGFAFDGDGDRCICVDEKGVIRDGDHILYASALEMLKSGELEENAVIATVTANGGLICSLEKRGINVLRTRVGDRFVYEKMEETGAMLGGEQSGHIIFRKYAVTGDGILTAVKLVERAVENKKRVSELFEGLEIYPQVQENVRVKNKTGVMQTAQMQAAAFYAEEKLREAGGRLLLRPSGTEELIRVLCEAPDETLCREITGSLRREIENIDNKM